jgi:hypothetical protein
MVYEVLRPYIVGTQITVVINRFLKRGYCRDPITCSNTCLASGGNSRHGSKQIMEMFDG